MSSMMDASKKPILLLAHPRSCSTAFERMFMTQKDKITCIHEPLCDAYHFGPEGLSGRFEDEKVRRESGLSHCTYQKVLDKIENAQIEGKRIFIKDMAKSIVPPVGKLLSIPPSLTSFAESKFHAAEKMQRILESLNIYVTAPSLCDPHPAQLPEPLNPTLFPQHILQSLYKISTPPVSHTTGWHGFRPQDAGYIEIRKLFDYLREVNQIGSTIAGQDRTAGEGRKVDGSYEPTEICIVDADRLLHSPETICKTYCRSVGLRFHPTMLSWDSSEDQQRAQQAFQKSLSEHELALQSTSIITRGYVYEELSDGEQDAEWERKFGSEGARIIRENVNANMPHYEYLKQFAINV